MAAPIVAGAVALLLEHSPQLTGPELRALLARTVHAPRAGDRADASSFPGELDIDGALALLGAGPRACTPSMARSWIVPSRAFAAANGTEAVRVRVHPRCDDGAVPMRGEGTLRVWGRLGDGTQVDAQEGDEDVFAFASLPGHAGDVLTVHVAWNARELAAPLALPVGSGSWDARYGTAHATPSCAFSPAPDARGAAGPLLALTAFAARARGRRSAHALTRTRRRHPSARR